MAALHKSPAEAKPWSKQARRSSVLPALPAHCGGCIVYLEATVVQRSSADMFAYLLGSLRRQWKVRGVHICSQSELLFETISKRLLLWQKRVNRAFVEFPSQTLVFTVSRLPAVSCRPADRDEGQEGQEGLPLPFCGTKEATALLGVPHSPHLEDLEPPPSVHPTQRLSTEAWLAGGGEVVV